MDLLVEVAAKADRVQPQPALFGAVVGVQMELSGRMPVDVTIEAGHAEAGVRALAIVGGVEFFLREGGEQEPQSVQLNGSEDFLEEAIKVVDRDDFTARDVAELGTALKKNGRWKLGEKRVGKVEVDIEALEPGKHRDLQLGKDLSAGGLLGVWERRIGKRAGAADFLGSGCGQGLPVTPCGKRAVGPTQSGLPRDILAWGSNAGVKLKRCSRYLR